MTVCLCCLWYWARHVSVFNFNIYLRWLIVGCGVQFAATYRKKINVALKHASQKHTPQNAHSAEDLQEFVDAKFMIFCSFCVVVVFFWLVTTQTIPKKHETHLIFAQMIYFLWFTCCSCYIVFALRFFLFLSVKCLGCVNTSFFHFFFLQSIALYCSFKVQRSKSSTG